MSLAAFGCKKNKVQDKDKDKDGEYLAKMTEFKNKMCACPDKACSEKVSDEFSRWSQAHARSEDQQATPSEEDTKLEAVTEALKDCILKLEFPAGGSAAGTAGAAGGAGGAGATPGSGSPAAGSAEGAAAAGGSGSPAAGSNGSAAAGW